MKEPPTACPACGGPVTPNAEIVNRLYCPSCDWNVWLRYSKGWVECMPIAPEARASAVDGLTDFFVRFISKLEEAEAPTQLSSEVEIVRLGHLEPV